MKLRKFSTVLLPVALLALLAAGCGGGGDDSTAETQETTAEAKPALSKAALISQGDAICGEVNAAVGAIGAQEEGDIAEQTTRVADLYTNMVQNILDLGRPEDPTGYADFMAAAEELAKVEGEVALTAERGETAALGEAATAAAPALEEFQAQAAIYGFSDCSEGPSAPPVTGTGSGEVEEGGVEVAPEVEEEVIPEEVAPEEEIVPETGGAGGGVGEEVVPEGGGESGSGGGIGPG